jgi:hypothetical protein
VLWAGTYIEDIATNVVTSLSELLRTVSGRLYATNGWRSEARLTRTRHSIPVGIRAAVPARASPDRGRVARQPSFQNASSGGHNRAIHTRRDSRRRRAARCVLRPESRWRTMHQQRGQFFSSGLRAEARASYASSAPFTCSPSSAAGPWPWPWPSLAAAGGRQAGLTIGHMGTRSSPSS